MAQSLNNLKGGKNCTVDWDAPDKPTINVNLPEGATGGNGSQGIMAVYDVVESSSGSGSQTQNGIEIQYVDDREPKFIPTGGGGGGGNITIEGTNGTSYTGDSFQFASASDSNVTVSVDGSGVMTIGVYYV